MNWQTIRNAMAGLRKAKAIGKMPAQAIEKTLFTRRSNRVAPAFDYVEKLKKTLQANRQWRDSLFTDPPKILTDARKFPINTLDELKYRFGTVHKNYNDLQKAREYLDKMYQAQQRIDTKAVAERYKRLAAGKVKAYTQARNKVLKGVGAGAAGLATAGGLGYGISRWNNNEA